MIALNLKHITSAFNLGEFCGKRELNEGPRAPGRACKSLRLHKLIIIMYNLLFIFNPCPYQPVLSLNIPH